MKVSSLQAYDILELPSGADRDSVRTSYKRLALKWHPDKHDGAVEATMKFEEISVAYKRLMNEDVDSDDDMSMNQNTCFEQFQQVFFGRTVDNYSNGYDSSDEDDDDDDDDSDDQDFVGSYNEYYKSKHDHRKNKTENGSSPRNSLTAEEIEKNANELITEEEREKRRSEKRRIKKRRRREKKKVEKQKADQQKKEDESHSKQNGTAETKKKKSDRKSKDSTSEVEEFDQTAAFFTKVVSKKKKGTGVLEQPAGGKGKARPGEKGKEEESEELDPVVLRSRKLAIRGNQMATVGQYSAAIDLFTEAIKLDPRDFSPDKVKFFGNRSYCYDRMQQFDRALRDAEKAISIASDWPKGYFRKGRALAGLKLFPEAEQAFMQVLKLDRNCEDAMTELLRVRTYQLTEMGFSQEQAESALKRFGSVQQALDSLLAGVGKDLRLRTHGNNKSLKAENSLSSEVYVSDDDDPVGASSHTTAATAKSYSTNNSASVPRLQQQSQQQPHFTHSSSSPQQSHSKKSPAADVKMNPNNPEGLTALWVGNVLPEVTEKQLREMFSKHGTVTSVRCLPEKYCAFINYKTKESAGRAMANLQHEECAGQKLLVKFPDNPIVNGNVVIRKNNPGSTAKKKQTQVQQRYKKF